MDRSLAKWRWAATLWLVFVAVLPLAAPFVDLIRSPESWSALGEGERLLTLGWNSLRLAGLALVLALAIGVPAAVLLFRTDVPGRRAGRFVCLLGLFVPLPLVTSAWQLALGAGGWLPIVPTGEAGWLQGILPAAWVQAMAALPGVIVLVGLGLSWVEPELEEDALLFMPAWRVLLAVTLRRAAPSILLAAVWTALSTLGEIIVTDRMQVRTFAEEVYNQFMSTGSGAEVTRAAAVSLPFVAGLMLLAFWAMGRWRERLPERGELFRHARRFELGVWRSPALAILALLAGVLVGVPLAGLLWKAGLRYGTAEFPGAPVWDLLLLVERVALAFVRQARLLGQSLLLAALAGGITGGVALLLCWLCRGSRAFERGLWLLAAALWAIPGPLLGIGLLEVMHVLFELPGGDGARAILWDQPSPLPNLWACLLRLLPVALAILWPLVRVVPAQLEEQAQLDGLGPARRFVRLILPLFRGPLVWTMLVVGVLSLGELSAGKLVAPPGFRPFSHHVFLWMHSGADTELASLCLVLLLVVGAGSAAAVLTWPRVTGDHRKPTTSS